MRPHRRQPTRLCRPWDSPGKNTGVGCHFLLQCMQVKSESEVAQLCPTPSDIMDCSLHPWNFPGKSTGVGCHCLLASCKGLHNNQIFSSTQNHPTTLLGPEQHFTHHDVLHGPEGLPQFLENYAFYSAGPKLEFLALDPWPRAPEKQDQTQAGKGSRVHGRAHLQQRGSRKILRGGREHPCEGASCWEEGSASVREDPAGGMGAPL